MHDSPKAFAGSIDNHVGARLKRARVMRRITQASLAKSLGVTFQHIQKFENGSIRISAGRLFQLAYKLDVPISFFYAEIEFEADADQGNESNIIDLAALTKAKAEAVKRIVAANDPDAEAIKNLLERLQASFGVDGADLT